MNRRTHPVEPEELMAYLDGELSADRAREAAAHLKECAECQGFAASLGDVSQAFATWKVDSSDSTIPTVIESALADCKSLARQPQRGIARNLFNRRWFKPALAGAFAILVLAAIGLPTLYHEKKVELVAIPPSASNARPAAPATAPVVPPPAAAPVTAGIDRDRIARFSYSDKNRSELLAQLEAGNHEVTVQQQAKFRAALPPPSSSSGPMIIRTAQLSLITTEFDKARGSIQAILAHHRGYLADLKTGGAAGSGRTLSATLRVPSDQLDSTITDLKTLGRVESESQSGQDVTSQYVDLQARLENARNTSARLTDLLQNRTGKLSDVLEVEQELDRVRGEIEQMEAERKSLSNQVTLATASVTILEDYKSQLQIVPPSTSTRLSNAAVDGYRSAVDSILSVGLFFLSNGPALLLWGIVLFLPARILWKRMRRAAAQ